MQIGAVAAAFGSNTLGKHFEQSMVGFELEIPVGIRPAHQFEQGDFSPLLGGTGGDNLLSEHVQGRLWNDEPVEIALADGIHQSRGFKQIITSSGEEAALG